MAANDTLTQEEIEECIECGADPDGVARIMNGVLEAERERILDKRVMARLATDAAYRNAENAEEQAEREAEIEREEDEKLATS